MRGEPVHRAAASIERSTRGPGPGRRRPTRGRFTDRLARLAITLSGLGTIAAVGGVFVFLIWVVADLFRAGEFGVPDRFALEAPALRVGCDEYRTTVWTLGADGRIVVRRADVGTVVRTLEIGAAAVRAHDLSADGTLLTVGLDDGSVAVARLSFATRFLETDAVPARLLDLGGRRGDRRGDLGVLDDAVVERTVFGQFRVQRLEVDVQRARGVSGRPPVAVAGVEAVDGVRVASIDAGGETSVRRMVVEEDFLSGERTARWESIADFAPRRSVRPVAIHWLDSGTSLLVVYRDGVAERWSLRGAGPIVLAESVALAPGGEGRPTASDVLLGGSTLVIGDDRGRIHAWFTVPDESAPVDGRRLVLGHAAEVGRKVAIRAISSSSRSRLFVVGAADGGATVIYMTSEKRLGTVTVADGVAAVGLSPRNDAVLVATADDLSIWPFEPGHPEASWHALFGKVHYESHAEPGWIWQSSSASDGFEPKLSLVPLIFGTFKATFYAMLFALPLAILAAIYTSEFLSERFRGPVKAVVELMATLPSVVLGFLAGAVLSPVLVDLLPGLAAAVPIVPLAMLGSAYSWQLLPPGRTHRLRHARLVLTSVAIVASFAVSFAVGPTMQDLLFAGDVRAWLDGERGSGVVAWLLPLAPITALAVAAVVTRVVNPWLRRHNASVPRERAAARHLVKFAAGWVVWSGLTVVLAIVVHDAPTWFGGGPLDLRDGLQLAAIDLSPFGSYDPRNALVVAVMMGFAVVPIIYTIAEDALSSVPDHLRAASLGAGATPWQTAIRVVVPTAASGLFSAAMIGFGRAAGETMIVLMATGSTAVLEMNVLSGMRALSANIAIELPEAVPGSTQFRVLFLNALFLLLLTLVINTVAESVRLRFRRRAYLL